MSIMYFNRLYTYQVEGDKEFYFKQIRTYGIVFVLIVGGAKHTRKVFIVQL